MGVRIVDRPIVPDGYGVTEEGPYLEWADVEDWLAEATEYWLASTWPDGRPHVVPRWGVWLDERFWYDGSPETRHARNLSINPACALHLESGTTVTIGKRLADRIRANVTSGVAESREIRSNVEWQLSNRVSVEGSYDNVNDISSSSLGNLGADVRWRLEFE